MNSHLLPKGVLWQEKMPDPEDECIRKDFQRGIKVLDFTSHEDN